MTPNQDNIGREFRLPHSQPSAPDALSLAGMFVARIASATPVSGSDNQYEYGFVEVEKTSPGYGGWTDAADGTTGTAYNMIEDQNSATGILGNGVNADNLVTSVAEFSMQPCPVGTRVMIWAVVLEDGTVEYWFQYENAVDGGCV